MSNQILVMFLTDTVETGSWLTRTGAFELHRDAAHDTNVGNDAVVDTHCSICANTIVLKLLSMYPTINCTRVAPAQQNAPACPLSTANSNLINSCSAVSPFSSETSMSGFRVQQGTGTVGRTQHEPSVMPQHNSLFDLNVPPSALNSKHT